MIRRVKEAEGLVPEAGLRSNLNVAEPPVAAAKTLTAVARARAFHHFIFQWLILTGLTSLYPTFQVFLNLWGIYPTSLLFTSLWGMV